MCIRDRYWADPRIIEAMRRFVYNGGGFIGVGEPTAYQRNGHFFQLYDVLGVDKELGFSLSTDKYNWEEKEHFLTENFAETIDFGEEVKNIYALNGTTVLKDDRHNIMFAANTYGKAVSYTHLQRKVFDGGKEIDLTTKEFDLLMMFIKNKGMAFNREAILTNVWEENYYGSDRVVDDTLRRLRKKLPNLNIHTIYGYGYRLG